MREGTSASSSLERVELEKLVSSCSSYSKVHTSSSTFRHRSAGSDNESGIYIRCLVVTKCLQIVVSAYQCGHVAIYRSTAIISNIQHYYCGGFRCS